MLEINTDTLIFIILGIIVALLIAYNVSLLKLKRHVEVLDSAVVATLAMIKDAAETAYERAKQDRKEAEAELDKDSSDRRKKVDIR